ncbi:MAG: sulfotransferase [Nocardioides sp.]|jgi:hypothetical protein
MQSRADDLGYVFVVTYGRSGSTLVQGLLNSIPGYLVRGENNGALYHLFRYHQTLVDESQRGVPERRRKGTHPFFGISDFAVEQSVRDCRRLFVDTVLRPDADTRVTGFKEIRWYQPDLLDYVAWMQEVFPGARFVVNTRNHADVLKSKWWAKKDNTAYLRQIEDGILEAQVRLGEAAYRVHYDDYVADPSSLEGLFDWLGEPFDLARVQATLGQRHSV